jgi:hypothetical protein
VDGRPKVVQYLAPGAEAGAMGFVNDDQVEEVGRESLKEPGAVRILVP